LLTVVDRYEKAAGKKLRVYKTLPPKEPEEVEEQAEAGTTVRSAVAGVMYGARGTRLDLPKPTNVMACRVTKWTAECLEFLEHLLGYIKGRSAVHLRFDARGESKRLRDWRPDMSADADFRPRRTQTGLLLALTPLRSAGDVKVFLVWDWASAGQKYVKLSAPESETVAAVHALRVALRYSSSWWAMTWPSTWMGEGQRTRADCEIPDCVVVRQREDNTACITVVQRGWSAKMSHLPAIYNVSVLWSAERTREGRVVWFKEDTSKMLADPLTKLIRGDIFFDLQILVEP
jgi:hypothetical protein